MPKKAPVTESLSVRLAHLRKQAERHRVVRFVGGRGAAALLLGTALSIGGIAETLETTTFLVEKDLDAVRVVRVRGEQEKVVAKLDGNFTGNTVFKLAQVLPDRYVSRQLALFDQKWIATEQWAKNDAPKQPKRDIFFEEMHRISDAIRAEFFAARIPYGELIYAKAKKYDVDPNLVAAVIEQESRFHARAKSQVGARGLMQLMPRTGRWMGARDLYNPEQNIDAGVKYIAYLDKRFNGDLKKIVAAYNGGEGNVRRYRGVPPFRETRQYVKKVLKNYDKRNKQLEQYHKEQGGGSVPEADGTLTLR
ncbi:MAG TPA: lytic transglycosylase domain-containing protein [Thermoanaerobaculia bacterium]|jgi:soluble lytic murein transglycosylase-like protein|nr:lytic transglycosylase domain-containing protein [Thermoanaerobaculia bacterium]